MTVAHPALTQYSASEGLLRYLLAVGVSRHGRQPTVLLRLRPSSKLAEWQTRSWREFDPDHPAVKDVTVQVLTLFEVIRGLSREEIQQLRLWVDPEADYGFSLTRRSALSPSDSAIDVGAGWYYAVNRGDYKLLSDLEYLTNATRLQPKRPREDV